MQLLPKQWVHVALALMSCGRNHDLSTPSGKQLVVSCPWCICMYGVQEVKVRVVTRQDDCFVRMEDQQTGAQQLVDGQLPLGCCWHGTTENS